MDCLTGGMLSLTDDEFHLISDLVYEFSGIHLTERKKLLVQGRLSKLVKRRNCKSFKQYYDLVLKDSSGVELSRLIDGISTNHTFFYREPKHYEFLISDVIPSWKKNHSVIRNAPLRIWSAGCSSGEEPYTVAMVIREWESDVFHSADFGILATDISLTVLQVAMNGVYPTERLAHLPSKLKQKYFIVVGSDEWQVKQELKSKILFKRLNLMRDSYPFKELFDVIFCRNVMIYFDGNTCNALIKRFVRYLRPGGYLMIGHSESLGCDTQGLNYIMPATYRKPL